MKKLGIIIPTYNRKQFLLEALDVLLPQVQLYKNKVSVFICDNASTDGTQQAVKAYTNNSDIIKYCRHSENYGYFYNFSFGIEHIDAEYVFLHGDDDLITPYFVGYILSLIEQKPKVSLFHFNYLYASPNMEKVHLQYVGMYNRKLIESYSYGYELIEKHFNVPSYMSSNVFKRKKWLEHINDSELDGCYGYEWLYVMYRGILNDPAIFINLPLFIQRFSNLEDYSTKWPLYSLVGIYKVFECISLENNSDLLMKWMQYNKKENQKEFYYSICMVYKDRNTYRVRYKEMLTYLRGIDRFYLWLCLYIFPPFFTKNIVMKFISLISKLNIITHRSD